MLATRIMMTAHFSKVLCYSFIVLLLVMGQSVAVHGAETDQHVHEQHDCNLFVACEIALPSAAVTLEIIDYQAPFRAGYPARFYLSIDLTTRVRGPPSKLF